MTVNRNLKEEETVSYQEEIINITDLDDLEWWKKNENKTSVFYTELWRIGFLPVLWYINFETSEGKVRKNRD